MNEFTIRQEEPLTPLECLIDVSDYLIELREYVRARGQRKLVHVDRCCENTLCIYAAVSAIKKEIDKILNINNK